MKLATSSSAISFGLLFLVLISHVSAVEPRQKVEYEVFLASGGIDVIALPQMKAQFDLEKMVYISMDTQSKLALCTREPDFFCIKTSGFRFAVPTAPSIRERSWKIDDVEYRVERQLARLELLGTIFEDVFVISSRDTMCGATACDLRRQFVFSPTRGLLASLVATSVDGSPQIELDILRSKCGLAAAQSCSSR